MSEAKVLPREKLQELLDVTREIFKEDIKMDLLESLHVKRVQLSRLLADEIGISRTVLAGLVDAFISYKGLKHDVTPEDVVVVLNHFGWNVRLSE